jgi:hypothetical protein
MPFSVPVFAVLTIALNVFGFRGKIFPLSFLFSHLFAYLCTRIGQMMAG